MALSQLTEVSLLKKENKQIQKFGELQKDKPDKILESSLANTKCEKSVLLKLEESLQAV